MVQVTFDTVNDSLEELEQARQLIETAIKRKTNPQSTQPAHKATKMDMSQTHEETALDTPFFKITVKNDEEQTTPVPTLNQLIEDESITEDELQKMFKEKPEEPKKTKTPKENQNPDGYIEIIEYSEEK